jgi:2,4-diketo-3-deoxy-L-fuconate hydrolase
MQRSLSHLFLVLIQFIFFAAQAQHSNFQHIKLFRFGRVGAEKPGIILQNGKRIDVSKFGSDYDEKFFASDGINRLRKWLVKNAALCPSVPAGSRIGSCVARPSKIVGIGLNYVKHAKESGVAVPAAPILFLKSTTALSGPNDTLVIPRDSQKTDWEVELAIIMGKTSSYVSEEDAVNYIAGFSIMNDYSERAWQLEGTGQWTKGKSADGFAPLGPYLIPADIFPQFQQLRVWLTVNGDTMQNSNTSDMVFGVKYLVSYLSRHMTLLPGDVITTGTPEGVGLGLKPQRYLKPGDKVVTGIEFLGVQEQVTISAIEKSMGKNAYKEYSEWEASTPGEAPHSYEKFVLLKASGLQKKDSSGTKMVSGVVKNK